MDYLKPGYDHMRDSVLGRLQERNDEIQQGFLVGLIVFVAIMSLAFLLGWLPYIAGKKAQVGLRYNDVCYRCER